MIPILLIAMALVGAEQPAISGQLPPGSDPPTRVAWVPADSDDQEAGCIFLPPQHWSCLGLAAGARGVVTFVADNSIAYVVLAADGVAAGGPATWGRLVRVSAGGVSPADLHGLRITAWRADRSAVRPRARRFAPVEDDAVHVERISQTAFWVAGSLEPNDAFLVLQGPDVASQRIDLSSVASGPPEVPLFVAASVPISIAGRVESESGGAIEGADVELLVSLKATSDRQPPSDAPLVREDATHTDSDGRFEFKQLETGAYRIVARHPTLGRGEIWTTTGAAPPVVRLTPPVNVTGRVVRRGLPAPFVRIRFVPDASVWHSSVDPSLHVGSDAYTDETGRFTLPLPPNPVGSVQIIASDGAAVRVPVSPSNKTRQVALGDVALPSLLSAMVRLFPPIDCELSAAGPVGALGLSVVRATNSSNLYRFELPEPGTWFLNVQCGGQDYGLDPPLLIVPADADAPSPTIDAQVLLRRQL
jgi:hypothetical protein